MRCHAGRPDSIAHLQYSGILPDKGPLGMGQHALQQLSYSSGASGASSKTSVSAAARGICGHL